MKTLKIAAVIIILAGLGFLFSKRSKQDGSGNMANPSSAPTSEQRPSMPKLPDIPTALLPQNMFQADGLLQKSDDPAQGNLMMVLDMPIGFSNSDRTMDHTYFRTSRDYSAFIGKRVRAKFQMFQDARSFDLVDIIPLE